MQRPEVSRLQDKVLTRAKELITREIKLCKTLRAMISGELEAIVLNGDMDELLSILERKDDIISQLQLLADGWRDIFTDAGIECKANPDGFGKYLLELYPDDTELPGLIEQTHEISESIIKAENEAVEEMTKLHAGLRGQMVNRVQGRNAAASYARMGGSWI